MNRVIYGVLAACLMISTLGMGQEAPASAKPKKHAAKPKAPTAAEQLKQVNDRLDQALSQIKQQQDQIKELQQQVQQSTAQSQQQAKDLQTAVQQANDQAAAAQQAANALTGSVADLKVSNTSIAQSVQETQKKVTGLESPLSVHYKGLTLTPGGFLDAMFLERQRNENADVTSSLSGMPFGGIANSKLTEFRASSRVSRFFVTAEGKAGSTKLTGYLEGDFAGQAPTANQVQTNSFTPRIRQGWAQADFASGLTLTTGQMWSLITTDRKGIATKAEFIPMTLEASYVIGYNYVRQTSLRLTQKFTDKIFAAVEIANPETATPGGTAPTAYPFFGLNTSTNALSPNGSTVNYLAGTCAVPSSAANVNGVAPTACNPSPSAITNGFSTNAAPDVIAKVAIDPGYGHYEIKALGRMFRDRYNNMNNVSYGGGIGAAAILPVVAKKADFIFEGLAGRGIGRYGASAGPDVTYNPNGFLVPVRALQALVGVELHPTAKLDIFVYGGDEYYGREAYTTKYNTSLATYAAGATSNYAAVGYGSPLVSNVYCNKDFIPASTCTGANKNLSEGTLGYWYRFYKGSFGTFQWGAQYEYLERSTWSGALGAPAGTTGYVAPAQGVAPRGLDNIASTSFRFILP